MQTYKLNSFTGKNCSGNPAAVCIVNAWPSDIIMQKIATDNMMPETAFLTKINSQWHIRWFTCTGEIDLCGHATLAAGYVLFYILNQSNSPIELLSGCGPVSVASDAAKGFITLDFPGRPGNLTDCPDLLCQALSITPSAVHAGVDYMAVYQNQQQIQDISPNINLLRKLDRRGLIITAPGNDCDFVSRFFIPKFGIDEDHVTGSAHCQLTPYWHKITGKDRLHAKQLSTRGGELFCQLCDSRVLISGNVSITQA